jgi:DNA-binding transcriptional LysR family regulator
MPINEIRSITIFAKTAELGSIRKAAEAQSMTPQAASQAVAQLEQHLGVRLFHRTTRSISLTEAGRTFLDMALPALTAMQHALEVTRQTTDEIAGPLRIVGPRAIFAPVFWPLFDEYCSSYPEVQPDVELDDRIGNWVEDRVDVGFRIGVSPAEGVIARKLFPIQLIICAAPGYIARHGAPDTLDALSAHRCSAFRSAGNGRVIPWRIKGEHGISDMHVAASLCVNDEELETNTVLAGHVIGQLSGIAAASHIRAGRLVPLLTEHVVELASAFIYYGSRAAQPVRVRAFIDLALKRLADNADFVMTREELVEAEAKGRASAPRGAPLRSFN